MATQQPIISATFQCGWIEEPEAMPGILVTPSTLVAHNGVMNQIVSIDVMDGRVKCQVDGLGPLTTLAENGKLHAETGIRWSFYMQDGINGYSLLGTLKKDVTYNSFVTYKGVQYPFTLQLTRVDDGTKGARGPILRGPMDWKECDVGFKFEAGGDGDTYADIVIYEDEWYACQASHAKTADNYPGSSADKAHDPHLWVPAFEVPFVVTKILLTRYALIKNLGAEAIEMKDEHGNMVFEAKGGNVTCNKGTFKDVAISGHLTASTMDMKVSTAGEGAIPNGALCYNISSIKLPALSPGIVRSIKVLNSCATKMAAENLRLIPENSTVYISTSRQISDASPSTKTLENYGQWGNVYLELLGFYDNPDSRTVWLVNVLSS